MLHLNKHLKKLWLVYEPLLTSQRATAVLWMPCVYCDCVHSEQYLMMLVVCNVYADCIIVHLARGLGMKICFWLYLCIIHQIACVEMYVYYTRSRSNKLENK